MTLVKQCMMKYSSQIDDDEKNHTEEVLSLIPLNTLE